MAEQRLTSALIDFGAPTLMGLKPASLFRYRAETPAQTSRDIFRLSRQLAPFGLALRILNTCPQTETSLLYLYWAAWLQKILTEPSVETFLEQRGYLPAQSCAARLEQLCRRLRRDGEFPHEIGVFLGYPLEDVMGFIENHGRNYTCCGCWKAYGDPRRAAAQFAAYRRCTALCRQRYQNGTELPQLIADGLQSTGPGPRLYALPQNALGLFTKNVQLNLATNTKQTEIV